MNTDVLARVLTIEEVKQKMKDIRSAAVHYGGVVHCGERGKDELVIVSAKTWEELTSRRQAEIVAAEMPADPFAVFDLALQDGRLGAGEEHPEPLRRAARVPDESGLSVAEMVRLAGPEERPVRRRRTES
jgi:hypothetical protein